MQLRVSNKKKWKSSTKIYKIHLNLKSDSIEKPLKLLSSTTPLLNFYQQTIEPKKKKEVYASPYKNTDLMGRKEKTAPKTTVTKSSTTIKPPSSCSDSLKKDAKLVSGEDAYLVAQVCKFSTTYIKSLLKW